MPPANPLLEPPVDNIDDVLKRLEDIQTYLDGNVDGNAPHGPRDGVASFNYLYHLITQDVRDGCNANAFQDVTFMRELDVAFANRYLNALRANATAAGSGPKVWQALIKDRSELSISPMRFAIAGVNAHINFDLAFALITACEKMAVILGAGNQLNTYEQINDIFAKQMSPLRHHFETKLEQFFDRGAINGVADKLGDLSVIVTRDAAWTNASDIWPNRGDAAEVAARSQRMDDAAAMVSDAILAHV
jgi:hypothetical protein